MRMMEELKDFFSKSWVRKSVLVMIIIVLISPLFGYAYEPLDLVAEQFGAQESPLYVAPFPDYIVPILGDNPISGIIAGIIGTFITLFVAFLFGLVMKKESEQKQ